MPRTYVPALIEGGGETGNTHTGLRETLDIFWALQFREEAQTFVSKPTDSFLQRKKVAHGFLNTKGNDGGGGLEGVSQKRSSRPRSDIQSARLPFR